MGMELRLGVLCVLAAVFSHVSGQPPTLHAILGGKLELSSEIPPGTQVIGLLWKHGPDKVGEWDKAFEATGIDYYGTYKGRTTLNLSTGTLAITALTRRDSGVYSMELNGKQQPKTYDVDVIGPVPKPEVSWKPLSCGPDLSSCQLSCDGATDGAGPITYSWRSDDGVWEDFQKEKLPNITHDEQTKRVKTFSCKLKNPVSEEKSEPTDNPFSVPEGGGNGWIAVPVLFLALVAGGVIAYLKRDKIRKCIQDRRGKGHDSHAGDSSQPPDQQDHLLTSKTNETESTLHTAVNMTPGSTDKLHAPEHKTSTEVVSKTDRPEGGEGAETSTNHEESTGPGEVEALNKEEEGKERHSAPGAPS